MTRTTTLSLACIAAFSFVGCAKKEETSPPQANSVSLPLKVQVDNYPLKYFAERVAGDLATVTLPVPPNRDPAYWRPDDQAIAAMQAADIVFVNGAGFAKWYDKVSMPAKKLVDTSIGFQDRFITIEDAIVHSHGPEGEHSHAGLAPNTWLDPELAVQQARAIAKTLREKLPEKAETIDANLASLEADLQAYSDRLRDLVAKRNEPLLASHPVYDYLARYCGWNLHSVHWEPDETPEEQGWKELEAVLLKHPARWMIWEGPPNETNAQRLHGLGINSVVFDVCAKQPESGDYLTVMNNNLAELAKVYNYEPDGGGPAPSP